MGQDDRHRQGLADSMPGEMEDIDSSWDEESPDDSTKLPVVPDLEFDGLGPFDRVTSVPQEPAETLAARLMAESSDVPLPEPDPDLQFDEPELDLESGLHERTPSAFDASSASESGPPPELPSQPPPTGPAPDPIIALESDLPPTLSRNPRASSGARQDVAPPRQSDAPVIEIDELSLEAPAIEAKSDPALSDLKDRYATGDFTGALVIAESILESDPDDLEAKRYAESCREVLTQMYASRLGQLDQIVIMAIPADQVRWLSLDHRAGFLLSLVDGASSIEELLDISGMPRLDALRLLYTLLEQRVIALEPA